MRKKLRSRRGFSLTETLLCVALLALMTAAGTTVASTVLSTRNDMMEVADAQVLASTVLEAVSNEIRYGEYVTLDTTVSDNKLTLTSSTFGENTEFAVEASDGHVTVTSTAMGGGSEKLLPDSAYTMGLKVTDLSFAKGAAENSVVITVKIGGRGDHTWEKALTVTPINGLTVK